MNKWMKFVALILALVMIVQVLPVIPASAAEHEQDAVISQQSVTVQATPQIAEPEPEPTAPAPPEPAVQAVRPAADTEDLTWTLADGVLTISGTGDMPNWTNLVGAPWVDRKDEITTVIVAEGITSVGNYAFASCYSLVSVTLPEGMGRIGDYAFYRCSSLNGIDLPAGVTALGSCAFLGCSALETIDIPEGVSTMGTYAFDSCSALRQVTLPGSLTEIQSCTFQYCDKLESIVIPEGVTAIGGYAFYFCKTMTEISLPGSLTNIGNYAFSTCRALKSVEIPEGVTSIGSCAFYDCRTMTEISLPGTLTTIGSKAFTYCDELASVVIPDSVTDMGSEAFRYCPKLRSVQLSASMSRINSMTFDDCTALETIEIPRNITAIDSEAFRGCKSLTAVSIPDSVTTLGKYAFNNCTALRSARLPAELTDISSGLFASCTALESIEIPETVTTINGYAFSNCSALKSAVLPAGLTTLGNNAFYNCAALEEIHIPVGVTGLQGSTFENCSALHTVTIPEGLTQISSYAFKNCPALEEIVLPGSLTSLGKSAFSGCSALRTVTMPPRLSSFGANMFQSCASLESIVIPEGVTAIGNNTFQNCAALASVTLPESVTSIGKYALSGCASLEELQLPQSLTKLDTGALAGCGFTGIDLPEGLTTVGEYVFMDCKNLEHIAFPDTVTSLGAHALENCSALVEAVLPNGITELAGCMFWNCTALESVTLPQSLISIGSGSFRNCPALEEITFPDTLTTIASEAFRDCTALRSVRLPEQLADIGYSAFANCSGLETLSIPGSVTNMGSNCFSNCTSLRELTLAEGLTVLGSGTFYGCTALEQVEIPGSVTRIEDYVFQNCSALREVVFHDGLTDIGDSAFLDCIALEQVTLPDTVTDLGSSAFSGCAALKELILSGGLTEIQYGTFLNCSSLTRIDIPANVMTLDGNSFYGCTALSEVYITDSVTYIGYGAFQPTDLLTFYTWPGAYAWSYAEQNDIRLVNVLTNVDLTLTVLDENGNVLTGGFTVEWYATDSDEVLATGSTLRGANKEAIAYDYRIVLGEELSRRYRQPNRTPVVIENGSYDLKRTLSPIGELTLTGIVTDEAGAPVAGAALELTQIYNELYETQLSAVTDGAGAFSVKLDAVPTRIGITAGGCYSRTVNADLSEKTGTHQLGLVALRRLPTDRITLNVELVHAHESGVQGFREKVADPDKLSYSVHNVTRDCPVTDLTVQNSCLYLGEDAAAPGDIIRITAADPENTMAADTAVLTLDENRTGSAVLLFRQHGTFRLSSVISGEKTRLMVFDADGALVDSAEAFTGYTGKPLAEGTYQLVLLEKNSLLRSAASLEMLDQLGLTAGTDYAKVDVTVRQELITDVEAVAVPTLDESKLSWLDGSGTLLRLDRTLAYPEQPVVLRLSYKIDSRYPSSDETVRIHMPADMTLISSVFLGREAIPYSLEEGTLIIPVHAASGQISMYVSAGKVGTHSVSASLDFVNGGSRVLQPLGQASVRITAGVLNVPNRTSSNIVHISGVTMPDRQVQVLLNGRPAATAVSNAVGSWEASVDLSGTWRNTFHEIQAKISGKEEGTVHPTEPEYVIYDKRHVEVSTVTMYNKIHYGLPQVTVFNFIRPDPELKYLVPTEDKIYYSFRVNFAASDGIVLKNVVLVVDELDGDERRLRCRYDEDLDCWLTGYTTRELEDSPRALGVSFAYNHEPADPIIDADVVTELKETMLQIAANTDAELDAIEYVDDGSTDDYDFHQLAELIDRDLDDLEQSLDEAEYLYDTTMDQLQLEFSSRGSTITTTMGGITTDTTTIQLEEVDEEALLAEGYEKIMSTDGSCLYQKIEGNTVFFVDPATRTKIVVRRPDTVAGAQAFASDLPKVFELTETELYKGLKELSELAETIKNIMVTASRSVEQLDWLVRHGEHMESKIRSKAKQLRSDLQVYIDMAIPEDELNELREMYDGRLKRLYDAADRLKNSRAMLKAMKILDAVSKAVPIFGLIGSLKQTLETNGELKRLWLSLPGECPGDASSLEAVKNEITALAWFLYGKIALDVVLDVASIASVFATGVIGIPFTGGASIAAAAVIVAGMTVANLATDWMVQEYSAIKMEDIKLMIANLECDLPEDEPSVKPVRKVSARVVIDPSGYVYEAVPSNRVEGVKAEIYYKDGDQDVLWDAADYDQVNPVYTDAAGFFHWDVPVGQWLVKFSKDGYYDTDSRLDPAADDEGYLPVPPPQTEVNTAIVSKAAPEVQSVRTYEGEVLVIFSQYMKPDTVGVTVSCGGAEVSGTLAASNAEWNYAQTEQYATVFRFTPDTQLSGTATVTVNGVNYAGTAMTEPWQGSMHVIVRPEGIYAAETAAMTYGTEYQLEVQILPTEAGAGKTVTAESLAPMLLRVDTPSVTADENGRAIVTVYGELPGNVDLNLRLEGTDLETATEFTIALETETAEICEKVTASIPNGSTVAPGTMLELYTATEGAEIYYTLDGTCPCVVDSPSRIFYDGPITLTEDVFLIAYAVKEGAQDSPTAGFIYTVCDHSDTLLENDRKATCTEDGYTGDVICDDCGTVVEQGSVIPAPGHDWDEGVVTVEPTEDHDGEKRYTCRRCGETKTEVLPALNHEHAYDAVVTEPTCTEGGFTIHTCRCGESYVDSYTEALGHNYESVVTEPTCTEPGYTTHTCARCGDSYTDEHTKALGHRLGRWFTVLEATCTSDGLEHRECSRCDHAEERTIEAAGHDYESVVTEPTCTKGGYTTHTCLRCGASYKDRYTNATGHDYESVVTEPTCTEPGYITHTCLRCGDSYTDSYTNALGHSFGAWTPAGKGMEERKCERCGFTEQRPASGPVNPFTDVPEGSFYYEPVLWAVEKGITNGTTPTTFGPNDQCMRAHVVTFLWRAAGSPEPSSTVNPFVDVKTTDFYYKAVLWAVEKGVTNGLDATHFGPFAYCNRAQVVTFLYRSLGSPAVESRNNPFTDVPEGQWFTAPVLWAVEKGVTNGLSADQFGPNAICNRAQIVTFLYRAFGK